MPTPIFVLGVQRSGTTWLANLVNAHPKICGVVDGLEHGTRESTYFRYYDGRYGDLRIKANYIEFVEVLCASDYFVLAGVTREFLYGLWPSDYAAIFRQVMDAHAEHAKALFWVEKSPDHTLFASRIAALYPDACFIAIERDAVSSIASLMEMSKSRLRSSWRRYVFVINNALRWVYYQKAIDYLSRASNPLLRIRYSQLKADTPAVAQEICEFLGLEYDEQMLETPFQPNSSFTQGTKRGLSAQETRLVQLG
jgi:hypothetical protein